MPSVREVIAKDDAGHRRKREAPSRQKKWDVGGQKWYRGLTRQNIAAADRIVLLAPNGRDHHQAARSPNRGTGARQSLDERRCCWNR
jgi:hypothetical protein